LSVAAMSVKTAVLSQIQQVADESRLSLPALTDDLVLLESGLDSLGIAILVARLEDALGLDPFTEFADDDMSYPVTLGAFIELYQRAADANGVDTRSAR
jgi:acyl carrier protein